MGIPSGGIVIPCAHPSWSPEEIDEATTYYSMQEWVKKARRGYKRIRIATLCCIHYEMEKDEWWTTEQFVQLMIDKDARGSGAMNLTVQRLSFFLTFLSKKGALKQKTVRRKKQYQKVIR